MPYCPEPSRRQWSRALLLTQSFRHTLLNCASGIRSVGSASPGRSAMQSHGYCQMPPHSSQVQRSAWTAVSLRDPPDIERVVNDETDTEQACTDRLVEGTPRHHQDGRAPRQTCARPFGLVKLCRSVTPS